MGNDILEAKDYTFYYSGDDKQGSFETDFLINKTAKTAVSDFTLINGRLCCTKIKTYLETTAY